MPSTATFTANAIIVTNNDGQQKTERAYSKLACYGRVIEDVAGLGQGEKILSIVASTGESLISLANNPSLYPGNTIDGQVDFDAAKTAVFDAIGISGAGGGGGGGGLTQSQTRDAVRDGANASTLVVGLRGALTLATLTPTQINAGATVAEAATTVRQRLLINNSDQPVYWNPGTVTPTATNYDHAIVPGGYLEPTYLGECRVFGVGLTAGELRIRDYS